MWATGCGWLVLKTGLVEVERQVERSEGLIELVIPVLVLCCWSESLSHTVCPW